jgi:hypothetical protein
MQGDFQSTSFYTFWVMGRRHDGIVVMALASLIVVAVWRRIGQSRDRSLNSVGKHESCAGDVCHALLPSR